MKHILVLLFLLPVLAKAQQPSAEALAKEFIAAVKANSKERFIKLYPDKATLRQMFTEMLREGSIPVTDTAEVLESMENMDEGLNKMYAGAMQIIKAKKINPAQLVYKSANLKEYTEEDTPGKLYQGNIIVTAAGKTYYIEVNGILEYKGSFYGIEVEDAGLVTKPKK